MSFNSDLLKVILGEGDGGRGREEEVGVHGKLLDGSEVRVGNGNLNGGGSQEWGFRQSQIDDHVGFDVLDSFVGDDLLNVVLGEDGGRGGREEEVGILGSLFDGDKMWGGSREWGFRQSQIDDHVGFDVLDDLLGDDLLKVILGEDGRRGRKEEEVDIHNSLLDGDEIQVGNGHLNGW
ncbi:hypothetical protein DEO72_LG10g2047 [Vigna unguiculata]|uniref:Uncharacterized protein n=1 Tax=Vigna unguiculata TaxID=3917 RepID=A0A4D6NF60_VIGUN|nr:hypothetical protein DEO72_LG10g2047 [Vigna unguiculata]